jgi:plastocyanin
MMNRSVVVGVSVALFVASVALITACTKKSSNPVGPVSGADVTITIVGINGNMSFSPNPAAAKVGQKVAWRNNGGTTHTATADGGAFNTGGIADGGTSALITMGTAGAFGYHCSIHPSMVATLNVNP